MIRHLYNLLSDHGPAHLRLTTPVKPEPPTPRWVQEELIKKAAEKRARRKAKRLEIMARNKG